MWLTIKEFLTGLLYEQGSPSLTRFMPFVCMVVLLMVFIVVTAVVLIASLIYGKNWDQYGIFATATVGGGSGGGLIVLGNKILNEIKGSPAGVPYQK